MKTQWKCFWAVAVLTAGMVLPGRAQMTQNGSFQSGTGTAADNWVFTVGAAVGTAANYPAATGVSPYGTRFLTFNQGTNTPGGNATQDIAGLSGTTMYQLSFVYGAIGTTGTQTLQLTINATSVPLPAQTYTVTTPSLNLGTVWTRATYTFVGTVNQVPSGITFADIGVNLTGDSDLVVDDVSLIAVPEPGTFAWVGGGGLAVACWLLKRKRRAGMAVA